MHVKEVFKCHLLGLQFYRTYIYLCPVSHSLHTLALCHGSHSLHTFALCPISHSFVRAQAVLAQNWLLRASLPGMWWTFKKYTWRRNKGWVVGARALLMNVFLVPIQRSVEQRAMDGEDKGGVTMMPLQQKGMLSLLFSCNATLRCMG